MGYQEDSTVKEARDSKIIVTKDKKGVEIDTASNFQENLYNEKV